MKNQAVASSPDKESDDPMKDYEAKDHWDTLMRAHAIMNDPKKMAKVHKMAGIHKKVMRSVDDLRAKHKQLMDQDQGDQEPDSDDEAPQTPMSALIAKGKK